MYKLLIFILLPFFAFSNDLNLESVCSSPDQDSVTEKLEGILCGSGLEGEECRDTLRTIYNLYIEAGWTQKQLNYFAYYVSQGKRSDRIIPRFLIGGRPPIELGRLGAWFEDLPFVQEELLYWINVNRVDNGLPILQNVSHTTPGCENLFPTRDQTFNIAALNCYPDQDSVTDKLFDVTCRPLEGSIRESCKINLMQAQRTLIEKGWTQQQLNYIGYYVLIGERRDSRGRRVYENRRMYTEHIRARKLQPPNKGELLDFINNIRTQYIHITKIKFQF